ncbi:TonB-dependent receptor [Alteromonas halophila]|uniref:Ligand-gated channel n=1 Tax=Alteromonas halophila TaxID=516698 RepID=A0A918JDP3_9ALTE|nr:TonB-dependent receptor [Alteromonas halophila]GGW74279.1 ligand-gated channel [Alteromonas halophila]
MFFLNTCREVNALFSLPIIQTACQVCGFYRSGSRRAGIWLIWFPILFTLGSASAAPATSTFRFDIPAQDANAALTELAKQANITLLFPFELAKQVKTNSLQGTFTLNDALRSLLEGTALAVTTDDNGSISIRSRDSLTVRTPAPQTEQQSDTNANHGLERIAVVGTRNSPRSVAESPVPLDILSAETLGAQGDTDTLSMLSALVPSLNVNDQPINDATSLVRPANLRGMASDHTLLLLNGKRRHRSAVITFLGGGLSDGAQGPDISVIPAYALKQVEVLRDGAAAQYGSDAIAGVINFVLKDAREGGSVSVQSGQYGEGDGELLQIQGNVGLPLGEKGFANLTAEYRQQNATSRSVQRDDAQALTDAGNPYIANPAQVWGTLDVDSDIKFAANLGWEISATTEGFAFANVARREIHGGFYYRHPHLRQGVFSRESAVSEDPVLLVADLDGLDQGIACPQIFISGDNVLENPDYQRIADNSTALGQNCFAYNEWYPGGFTPRFGGTVTDVAAFVGVTSELRSGWSVELSAGVGYSDIEYALSETVNPSLGPSSPTRFSPGSVSQVERTVNLDFVRLLDIGMEEMLSVAIGAEWRRETYFQKAGDEASYLAGRFAYNSESELSQGFSVGSNGFPGYQPQSAGHWSRRNWALYSDVELYPTPDWQLGVATRVERFSDFGTTFDGKISTRYMLNEAFALRGSLSTGFKAPTVGQSNVINVTTAYGANGLEDQATLPPTDLISQQLGATPLTPEESVNLSLGVVYQLDEKFLLTFDYFNIRLSDRISTTSAIPLTDEDIQVLDAQGRPEAATYNAAKYFTNDFDTRTQGVDLVLHYDFGVGAWQHNLVGAFNWTDTQVERVTLYPAVVESERVLTPNLTTARIRMLEDNLPAYRGSLTWTQKQGALSLVWRLNHYAGFYEDHLDASAGFDIESGSITTLDADVRWQVTDMWSLTLGANNLFDRRPDENPYQGVVGARYPSTSPSGINGAFYYLGTRLAF